MDWQIEYYKKINGTIPVLEFLLTANKIPIKELDRAVRYREDYERRCKDE